MSSRHPRIRSVFALAVLGPLAAAQTIEQGRVAGVVRNADGSAAAKANVILVSRPLPAILDSGATDRVEVETDGRGRFRARVLPGRDYSAWAIVRPNSEDPHEYRVSRVADGVRKGHRIRLRLSANVRRQHHLRFRGLEAWKHRGPLRFFVMDPTPETIVRRPIRVADDATAIVPATPGYGPWIEVDDKNGLPIWQGNLTRSVVFSRGDHRELHLAPPRILRVVAHAQGATPKVKRGKARKVVGGPAVAGTEIYFARNAARLPLVPMGKTDAQGVLDLELSYADGATRDKYKTTGVTCANDLQQAVVIASGPAHADAYANLNYDGATKNSDGIPEVRFELRPGATAHGRLMLDEETPAANARLLVYASLFGQRGGGQIACTPKLVPCDAEGRFRIQGRSPSHRFRLTWVPTATELAALESGESPLAPEILIASDLVATGKARHDIGTVRVDRLSRIDVRGFATDAQPLRNPIVILAETEQNAPNWPVRARADRRGRVRFLVRDKLDFGLWLASPFGYASGAGKANAQKPTTIELRLAGDRVIRGQVVADGDNPVPHAEVRLTSMTGSGGRSNCFNRWSTNRMLAGVRRSPQPPIAEIEDPRWQIRARVWSFFGRPEDPIVCDAQGKFEFSLPSTSLRIQIAGIAGKPGKWKKGLEVQRPTSDFVELRIRE